jgi:UDP-perosamine 4-acetyltransferase
MQKVVVLGSSGHAKVVVEILESLGEFEIVGVTTKDGNGMKQFCGYPILGDDGVLPSLLKNGVERAVIGVGGYRDNHARKLVFNRAKSLGFELVTAIAPSAIVAPSATIGEGSVLFPGAIINTKAAIGRNVVVATGSTVDHETLIEDHVLISAGVTVGANVHICEGALLAIGSTVITGVRIGANSLVAAGAVVVKDVARGASVFGVPARSKGEPSHAASRVGRP